MDKLFADLLKDYFPNSRKVESERTRSRWFQLLEPYNPKNVQHAVIEVLRTSEHFPDPQKIAVRCEAVEPAPKVVSSSEHIQRPYSDATWMASYIRKLAAHVTDEQADEIHAAGLRTWREAEAAGEDFAEWNRTYRARFPVGAGS